MTGTCGRTGAARIAAAFAILLAASMGPAAGGPEPPASPERALAEGILRAAGVAGGLVVHVGCGDGRLTAALRAGPAYLVHGLETGAGAVAAGRAHIRSLGLYGPVSIDEFDGRHLPYAENLVNLLVVQAPGRVPMAECLRVLAPGGVAMGPAGDGAGPEGSRVRVEGRTWWRVAKPWPDDIDEWTHSLHDPGGNAVARDRVVGPPARLQWTAGPRWARSHGWTPSVSAMVSARGRLFSLCDETLTGVDGTVPSKWVLVARDAFNGLLLWKRPVPRWGSAAFSGTPDTGGRVTVGRFTMPPNTGRRLVAMGDTVYATLGAGAPVTALDAATGAVERVYAGTERTDEILCTGERLILSIAPDRADPDAPPGKRVCAVDARTGRILWKKGPFPAIRAGGAQDPFGRLELAAGDGRVFLLTTGAIECLAAETGERAWRIDRPPLPPGAIRRVGFAGMYEYRLAVMVYHAGVLLLAQPEPNIHHTYHTMPGTLYAFDARDGRRLWAHAYGGWGHCTQPDVFVVGEVVWTHVHVETEYGFVWGRGFKAKDPSRVAYRIQALDLRTGALRREIPTRTIFNVGHHHRCYRNRSTARFLLSCRRGVEFVDLRTGENVQNHWVRSGCLLGYLPCNGLLYVAPHPCACYIDAKLTGFNALAPAAAPRARAGADAEAPHRLLRGPAYGKAGAGPAGRAGVDPSNWPTYRHDPRRSGATASPVPVDLAIAWRTEVGARLSAPVVAAGKVFVASVDAHTVGALDTDDGALAWTYTAGGRVDSPPTVYRTLAIFGSADGRVYCLRAADGALVWRFDAAPRRRLVIAFGALESAWPVPGSVLLRDGRCWFAAGRSSYLDGGIVVYALDPATGQMLHRETIYSPDPATGRMAPVADGFSMPGLLADIPAADGRGVSIRQMRVAGSGGRGGRRIWTTAGYLDPSWFNRTFWQVGRARTTGLMVLGRDAAYGIEVYPSRSRETVFTPGAHAYRLRCIPLTGPAGGGADRKRRGAARWERRLGIRVTAMVRAADTLWLAGPPDVVDPADPHGAWEGRKGGVLAALAAEDGARRAAIRLPSPPVWDGMAAAGGRLFVSTRDGAVICLAGKDRPEGGR